MSDPRKPEVAPRDHAVERPALDQPVLDKAVLGDAVLDQPVLDQPVLDKAVLGDAVLDNGEIGTETSIDDVSGPTVDDRVRVRRSADRAGYDRSSVEAILDAGMVAHVGTVRRGGPVVIPMFYVRQGDSLLLHGAPASGVIQRGDAGRNDGVEVCVTVTHVDGLVLARSAFHHSMNYRSVMVIGRAVEITDPDEKTMALRHFVEALVPGRQDDLRPTTDKEARATSVLRLSLEHASTKVRTGPPLDDEADYELPIWAGVVPMRTVFDAPIDDPRLGPGMEPPANVVALVADAEPGSADRA